MCNISEICPECGEKLYPHEQYEKDEQVVYLQCENCEYEIEVERKTMTKEFIEKYIEGHYDNGIKSNQPNESKLKPLFVDMKK